MASFWNWKIRSVKPTPVKDFDALKNPEVAEDFDSAVEAKLSELGCTRNLDPDATTLHGYMAQAIQHAVDTVLPDVLRTPGIKREVSEETKASTCDVHT